MTTYTITLTVACILENTERDAHDEYIFEAATPEEVCKHIEDNLYTDEIEWGGEHRSYGELTLHEEVVRFGDPDIYHYTEYKITTNRVTRIDGNDMVIAKFCTPIVKEE